MAMAYVLFVSEDKGENYTQKIDADFLDDEDFVAAVRDAEAKSNPYYIELNGVLYDKYVPL